MNYIENYKITIIDNEHKISEFIDFLNKFYEYNKKNKYVSIDFEYTNNRIKLWQVCFYYKKSNTIFVIMEKYIKTNDMNIIINKLLTSKIIKIFHGGESLDFPYLINVINNPKKIAKFLKYSFDTKFLCEYYKSLKNEKQVCNIYDAMLYFKVMTQNKYNELQEINKKNGPIWKVNWDNISKNNNLLIYTIYDVIYLKDLLLKMYELYKNENLKQDFYSIQKINTYVILKRNNVNYDYKINIENDYKYKVIPYYKNII
jgi:ribonuclease D